MVYHSFMGVALPYVRCYYADMTYAASPTDTIPPRSHIGGVLRAWRISAGLTQMQLAERLQTDQTTISSYEVGRRMPTSAALARLAQVFGISDEELGRVVRGAA